MVLIQQQITKEWYDSITQTLLPYKNIQLNLILKLYKEGLAYNNHPEKYTVVH